MKARCPGCGKVLIFSGVMRYKETKEKVETWFCNNTKGCEVHQVRITILWEPEEDHTDYQGWSK